MLERIAAYLAEQNAPVSTAELAERFLKIKAGSSAAQRIMTGLLAADGTFVQDQDGLWTLKNKRPDDFSFVLCQIFPQRCPVYQMNAIYLATVSDGVHAKNDLRIDYKNERFVAISKKIRAYIKSYPLLFDGFGNQRSNFFQLIAADAETASPVFSLSQICRVLFPDRTISSSDDLSKILLGTFQIGSPEIEFEQLKSQALAVCEHLRERDMASTEALSRFLQAERCCPDFSRYAFDKADIDNMPFTPGVYVMTDIGDEVIYVGKAQNLNRRVRSYFNAVDTADPKLTRIRQNLHNIRIIETGSELEALLLEYDLILKYQPSINQQFAVHDRHPYKAERYSRILLLPDAEENFVNVVLLNPRGRLDMIKVSKETMDIEKLEPVIEAAFFNATAAGKKQHAKIEIVLSWLARNSDRVSSIDMRTVASVSETVRLLRAHILYFDPKTKLVIR